MSCKARFKLRDLRVMLCNLLGDCIKLKVKVLGCLLSQVSLGQGLL